VHAARVTARRVRRRAAIAIVLMPTIVLVALELLRRGASIVDFPRPFSFYWLGGIVQSIAMWTPLVVATSRRRGALSVVMSIVFVVAYVLVMGTQSAFHAFWNVYVSIDGQLHSKNVFGSLFGTLPLSRPLVLFHFFCHAVIAVAIVWIARKAVRPGRWMPRGMALVALVAFVAPYAIPAALKRPDPVSYAVHQASPPDTLYIHGMVALGKETLGFTNESPDLRVQRRNPEKVPPLTAKPARKRNVVLVLQESLRADVSCVGYDQDCPKSNPWSNAVFPNRKPLNQMRSNASTTAISISNIWSGVRPTESRELLHRVPLLWEYAAAAGYDTAYWTSQNLMFGNARTYIEDLPISHGCVATHLDPKADLDTGAHDELVARRAAEEWHELKEPFFAVVHFSNVHYPYIREEGLAPWAPDSFEKSPERNEDFFRYYQNVAYRSDLAVAELLRAIATSDAGKRTVVVFTADHGEGFREHWQMGHTSSLYDEEVLVPTWIHAPPGTLSPEEEASIDKAKDEHVWHLDLGPTLLDLLGLWAETAMTPFRRRMMGHPITRPERTTEPVPMTNCTGVWECSFRNWGMMQGSLKVEAREWDAAFHCFDVDRDPREVDDLGERLCAPLPDLARGVFDVMPNLTPPGRTAVDWNK
jgi:glucan phosphoethanolaminetransferase (alkaline phosphatase superfamily)